MISPQLGRFSLFKTPFPSFDAEETSLEKPRSTGEIDFPNFPYRRKSNTNVSPT